MSFHMLARRALGARLSQEEFGALLGVSGSTIYKRQAKVVAMTPLANAVYSILIQLGRLGYGVRARKVLEQVPSSERSELSCLQKLTKFAEQHGVDVCWLGGVR